MPRDATPDLPRTIGFLGSIGVMVGIIIGSGIFRTPASIARSIDDPILILILWAVGGLIALFGAFTYAELITMHPESGGVYVFIREAFGRCAAFVFGWTYLLITKPLAVAGICVVMSEHLLGLLHVNGADSVSIAGLNITAVQGLTAGAIVLLTGINILGLRLGAGVAGVLTVLKVLALMAIIGLGVWNVVFGPMAPPSPGIDLAPPTPFQSPGMLIAIGAVMASVMWTYDGWSDVGAIAGEVKNPTRTLPRVFFAGTILVTVLYVAINAVYMDVVSLDEMRGMQTVAPVVMDRLIGNAAAVAVTVIIVIATLGATHGSIITGARVTYAQARDGLLFRGLGVAHPRFQSPARALIIQGVLACVVLLGLKTFENLAGGFIFTMWIFYGLGGAAIFVLRVTQPDVPRPFRCWGYPVIPGLFVLAAAAMTGLTIAGLPWRQTVLWLGVLVTGVPIYFIWDRKAIRARREEARRKQVRCPACGYSKVGLTGTVCPECGSNSVA